MFSNFTFSLLIVPHFSCALWWIYLEKKSTCQVNLCTFVDSDHSKECCSMFYFVSHALPFTMLSEVSWGFINPVTFSCILHQWNCFFPEISVQLKVLCRKLFVYHHGFYIELCTCSMFCFFSFTETNAKRTNKISAR